MNSKNDQRRAIRRKVDRLSLTFKNRSCRIFNISEKGVAFSIHAPRDVAVGKQIDSMTLNGKDPIEVAGLARHISHISQIEPGADVRAEWVCGAEFRIQEQSDVAEKIRAYIARTA